MRRVLLVRLLGSLAIGGLLAACGGSPATTATTTTLLSTSTSSATTTSGATTTTAVSTQAAGSAYAAAAAKGNAAIDAFVNTANAWPSSETGAQAEASAAPAIAALKAFETTLTDDAWPAGATPDVHTLVTAVGALVGDLEGLSAVTALSASTWLQQFTHDAQVTATDADLVRHDLGLPPGTTVPSSTT